MYLLAHLFNDEFEFERGLGLCQAGGFGAERIGLAVEFLHQKIEFFADIAALAQVLACIAQMSVEAIQLFGDINPNGGQADFLLDATMV